MSLKELILEAGSSRLGLEPSEPARENRMSLESTCQRAEALGRPSAGIPANA